jgi:hypothetical protein
MWDTPCSCVDYHNELLSWKYVSLPLACASVVYTHVFQNSRTIHGPIVEPSFTSPPRSMCTLSLAPIL